MNSFFHRCDFSRATRILVCGMFLSSLNAAEAQPAGTIAQGAVPEGPLLNPAGPFSQWTITFLYPNDVANGGSTAQSPPQSASLPRRIVTVKTQIIIHREITNVAGGVTDSWQVGETLYVKLPGQQIWGVYDKTFRAENIGSDVMFEPLPPSGFYNLDWINKDNFVGEVSSQKKSMLKFVAGGGTGEKVLSANEDLAFPERTTAFIDATTRLPVSYLALDQKRTYKFQTAPTTVQNLPPELLQQLKEGEAHRAKYFGAPKGE